MDLKLMKRSKRVPKYTRSVDWQKAPDIAERISFLISSLELDWLKKENIHCFRSEKSKTRALARIWGLPRVWQIALESDAAYVLEVISEHFDELSQKEKDKVLLHELAHVPRNFSGALLAHTRKRKGSFKDKLQSLIASYEKMNKFSSS